MNNSLRNILHPSMLVLSLLVGNLFAGPDVDYEFDPVIVTANRFPVSFPNLTRTVTVIDSQQIARAPVHSIADLLSSIGSVDLMRRGPQGVQAEAGIRGGSFEETLLLVDGVRMNDPQTAHHNFDIPVSLQDVKRIEILHGPGSGLYGADALAGVINIITKTGGKNSYEVYGGDFALAGGYVSLGGQSGQFSNQVSAQISRSDGYMENTDFKTANVLYNAAINTTIARFSLQTGYTNKKFGANSFYSTAFPDEREQTATTLAVFKAEHTSAGFSMAPQISWKKHKDDFMLDRQRPDWNRNRHTVNSISAELPVFVQSGNRTISFGGILHFEGLQSSNLGERQRTRGGIYCAVQQYAGLQIIFNSAVQACYYPQYGWKLWPTQDVAWLINKKIKIYASAGSAFRMPSFTELYYKTPANLGNPLLKYSQAVSLEAGLDRQGSRLYTHLAIFSRDGKNMIDWAREKTTDPWQVMNVANMNTQGLEMMTRYSMGGKFPSTVQCDWILLETGKATPGFESKYLFNGVKYQLNWGIDQTLPWHTGFNCKLKYTKRENGSPYALVDAAMFKTIRDYSLYMKISNLFNQEYFEVTGVELAGRWFSTGLRYTF